MSKNGAGEEVKKGGEADEGHEEHREGEEGKEGVEKSREEKKRRESKVPRESLFGEWTESKKKEKDEFVVDQKKMERWSLMAKHAKLKSSDLTKIGGRHPSKPGQVQDDSHHAPLHRHEEPGAEEIKERPSTEKQISATEERKHAEAEEEAFTPVTPTVPPPSPYNWDPLTEMPMVMPGDVVMPLLDSPNFYRRPTTNLKMLVSGVLCSTSFGANQTELKVVGGVNASLDPFQTLTVPEEKKKKPKKVVEIKVEQQRRESEDQQQGPAFWKLEQFALAEEEKQVKPPRPVIVPPGHIKAKKWMRMDIDKIGAELPGPSQATITKLLDELDSMPLKKPPYSVHPISKRLLELSRPKNAPRPDPFVPSCVYRRR